jgi:hypothetical protein
MATTHIKWWGADIELSHSETTQLTTYLNAGNTGIATLGQALNAMGITDIQTVAGAVNGLLSLGITALNACNAQQNGIYLRVIWIGVPWCRA